MTTCVSLFNIKCLAFWFSMIISGAAFLLCAVKLFTSPEEKSYYLPILTSIIGIFLPTPKLPKAEIEKNESTSLLA